MRKNSGVYAAYDIGGTKCASIIGFMDEKEFKLLARKQFATDECGSVREVISRLGADLLAMKKELGAEPLALGISCGGPLDAVRGIVQSPPNLPGWDDIPVTGWANEDTGLVSYLENDANAGAVAEWRYGAGRGVDNMIFLTFGTGLGAGVIIDGHLLHGAGGNAGELGHIRLADNGPVGYGKAGSFEGFCSGSGLARQMQSFASKRLGTGNPVKWGRSLSEIEKLDAKKLGELAADGDSDALEIFENCGAMLGRGLAVAVDLFNPQKIVIGSIFVRSEKFLRPAMSKTLEQESLSVSYADVEVVPAQLGENAGDVAALCVARENYMKGCEK
ncbi:MAG: ROK family protein [Lentisphaeria bacterium]|nr:ROK family protein [Lentisphaeria bacterium]